MIAFLAVAFAGTCDVKVDGGRIPDAERGIAFVTSKAATTPESASALDGVACVLTADPSLPLAIAVHTDAQGADTFNLAMSQARAEAVRDALVARGIAAARLTPIGYGETRPVAENATAAGRAQNRRVELWTTAPPEPRPVVPAPPPVVAPAPAVDPCPAWRAAGAEVPSWERCSGATGSWTCVLPIDAAKAAALATSCLGAQAVRHDGASWFVVLQDGAVAQLTAVPAGASLTLR